MKTPLLAVIVLCLGMQSAAQAQPADAGRASAANGQATFMRVGCFTCHGTVGHGGAGARLAPNTLPLEAFRFWVRTGTPGWSIASGMPAFPTDVVTDQDVADIRAFLAGLPAPRAANDIALLNR